MDLQSVVRSAATVISTAEAVVITAGAGMGVDSGLPDFRGDRGFWNAYPMYERLGISFVQAANPVHFARDPAFGWGFYGHRTNLYRQTVPHAGFHILLRWIERFGWDHFVVTSNVDGQFQTAGFAEERVLEVHGSIHHLQCLGPCRPTIWDNRESIPVDPATMRAEHIPHCPLCGGVARPNILMFGDFSWLSRRTDQQEQAFDRFLEVNRGRRLVVIELGAGTAIPTIRSLGERLVRQPGRRLVRINPREYMVPAGEYALPYNGLYGLQQLDKELSF